MPVKIEQMVLPGTELEPVAVTDKTLVVIRVDAVYPHGTAFRYDLVCYGLEPGAYDLRKYLQRKDGSSVDELPAIPFEVEARLPAGQMQPHPISYSAIPWLGGYRLIAAVVGGLWIMVFLWLIFPKSKKPSGVDTAVTEKPISLADRLRPLVIDAMAGRLAAAQLAELERALISYWRRRLKIENLSPVEAIARLRSDREAGPLMQQLENWLHRPGGTGNVDLHALLSPYQNIAPDALPLGDV